jgi:DNA-binding MarR family transcriptional regulator
LSKTNRSALAARPPDPLAKNPALAHQAMRPFMVKPGYLLARINQIYVSLYGEASGGETVAQTELLLLVASNEKLDQISLARAAGLDTSTTALILDNLQTRGLVVRESDSNDRRRSILHLTAAGRKRVPGVRESFLATQSQLAEPLGKTCLVQLKHLLRHIATNPLSPAPLWVPEDREGGIGENVVTGSLGFLCRRALQLCEAYFLSCAAPLSLTPRQFSVLFLVNRKGQLSQVEFSRLFGLDPATASVVMKNLTTRGLLDRRVCAEDRRARLFSLTATGRGMLGDAQPLVDKSERLVFHGCTKADVRQLVARLQQLVKAHSGRLTFPGLSAAD